MYDDDDDENTGLIYWQWELVFSLHWEEEDDSCGCSCLSTCVTTGRSADRR